MRLRISPSGLIFYTGDRFKTLKGKAILGGLSSEALILLTLDGNKVIDHSVIKANRRIRDVLETPEGDLLLLGDEENAELIRLTPAQEKPLGS